MMSDAYNREQGNVADRESEEVGGRPQGSPPHSSSTPAPTMNGGSSPREFAVGVDGGGSKTLAVVVDRWGNERGRAVSGSSNHTGVGIEQAVRHIYSAVEEAARQAGCVLPLSSAWFGLAGVDRPADYDLLLPYLKPLAREIRLTNDAELVLSGLPGAVGIALIAGTGSIGLGRDARGTIARSGGWGHIIGDEGSGYDLGRRCLQAVSKATDGRGQATMLVEMLLKHWCLDDASQMIGKVYTASDKTAIASLSSLVIAAARDGDEVASSIVDDAARELALAALAVKNMLNFDGEQVALALGGGLFLHETDFRVRVIESISARISIREVVTVEEPALSGARAAITHFSQTQCKSEGDRTPLLTYVVPEGDRKGLHPAPHHPRPYNDYEAAPYREEDKS